MSGSCLRELWYARHAKPLSSGVCYGRHDVPVIEPAPAAAVKLYEMFPASVAPQRVWSSPSLRCLELASALARLWGAELCVDERVCEFHFGLWEGREWQEIERTEPEALNAWMNDWQHSAPPGGETPARIEARARAFLETLGDFGDDSGDVLVAHAGFVRALQVACGACDWAEAMQRRIEYLSWARLPARTGAST